MNSRKSNRATSDEIHQNLTISGQTGSVFQIGKVVVGQRHAVMILGIVTALLTLGATIFLYFGLRASKPERMTGNFRIAVVSFVEVGQSQKTQVGEQFAQEVYLRLQQTFDELKPDFTVTVWGPDQAGRLVGQTPEQRANLAAQIAERIGANIVVYGNIESVSTSWQLTPEFYVAAENFYQAEEITGQYQLGTPLEVDSLENPADRIEFSGKLTARTQALSYITIGLGYYAKRDFEKALTNFQAAEAVKDWEDGEGRQVLYILNGNASIKLDDLEAAQTYYQQAIDLDHEYARGYIGLANVYYQLALQPFEETKNPDDTDIELLDLAIAMYEQALQAENQPPFADIASKAHFGLGQTYFMYVYVGEDEVFNLAIGEFQSVIEDYADGTNPRIREIAAESHARLALIYELSGYTKRAITEYQLAATLLNDNPDRQRQYEQRILALETEIDE
jgi:hypothetical protein